MLRYFYSSFYNSSINSHKNKKKKRQKRDKSCSISIITQLLRNYITPPPLLPSRVDNRMEIKEEARGMEKRVGSAGLTVPPLLAAPLFRRAFETGSGRSVRAEEGGVSGISDKAPGESSGATRGNKLERRRDENPLGDNRASV